MASKAELARRIGNRMTALRKQQGLTLIQLAKKTKLSPSLISRISNGKMMASIKTLGIIADEMMVDIGIFFQSENIPKSYVISRHGMRRVIVPGETNFNQEPSGRLSYDSVEPLAEGMVNPLMLPLIVTATKDSEDVQAQSHGGQEFLYVLQGECLFTLGDEEVTLNVGDALYLEGSIPHKGRCISKKEAKILSVHLIPSRRVRNLVI